MIFFIAIGTFIATMLGGLVALRFRDKLHLILGFSAGAVIAVAFFDLMPEAISLGDGFHVPSTVISFVALGFFGYLILDRLIFLHSHTHEEGHEHELSSPESRGLGRGLLGAGSLSVHSFIDGAAVGLAFQVSAAAGVIVAAAVLAHDFSDGINTVNLIVKNGGERGRALCWLLVDAAAPVLGIISTLFFTVPAQTLSIILAVFAGFFLYIGATDLIPESHHAHPKFLTTAMTLLGAGVLYIAIRSAGV